MHPVEGPLFGLDAAHRCRDRVFFRIVGCRASGPSSVPYRDKVDLVETLLLSAVRSVLWARSAGEVLEIEYTMMSHGRGGSLAARSR